MRLERAIIKLPLVLIALAFVAGFSINNDFPAARAQQDLPEGKGVQIVRDKCISCHEADLIVSQRLSRQGWTREIEKMVRWGAPVAETEKETILDYLAANFGATPVAKTIPPPANYDRGKEIFENKCVACHEADLTVQQRLSRQGWTREVEKMIRWGAAVTEEEKAPLVDYLFENYGPRK